MHVDTIKMRISDKLIELLCNKYKYAAVPPEDNLRAAFRSLLPKWCHVCGDDVPLVDIYGTPIAKSYNRIVIGDYGAYVEFSKLEAESNNFKIAPGEEYRFQKGYKNCKYFWLTPNDDSGIKIYLQKHRVVYADYVPNMYYVSVYDVFPKFVEGKNGKTAKICIVEDFDN